MTSEHCLEFGERGRLAGIVTEPAAGMRRAMILVSAGLVPKFGPYRLYVELARALASRGVRVLRFDLGGIGDSPPPVGGGRLAERTIEEIGAAAAYLLTRYDAGPLIVGGLCSGAEDALRFARRDPRVAAVVMIDPFRFRTRGWGWRDVRHRLLRRTLRAAGLYAPLARSRFGGGQLIKYRHMAYDEAHDTVRVLLAREVRLHFVYTAGARDGFNHPAQLYRMFPDLDLRAHATVDFLPRLDHTQLLAEDRRTLVEAVIRRVTPVEDVGRSVVR